MKNRTIFLSVALAMCMMLLSDIVSAQFTQVWKVNPGTWPMLSSGDHTRGAALNRSNGHYLVTRRDLPRIYVFDATNGMLLDSLNMTGISGGTVAIQDIEATSDGVIYATNLILQTGADTVFKIYRWANDSSTTVPTVAFSGRPLDKNGRFGDAFDVAGTGTGTVMYVGGNSTNTDSVLVFTTSDGVTFTNSGTIRITGNDAGMGIAQITPGGDFLTSRYASSNPIRLYSGTGAGRLDAVPTTVTPAFQADITYLEAGGRKWVASTESLATAGHGHKGVLLNTTYGLSGAVKVGTTPVIGTAANTGSIGGDIELQYNAADSTMTIYLMIDNNGIAAYKTGNVLAANLPPFAGNLRRTQFVPAHGTNDTVLVDVQDDGYIPKDSVKLYFNVDGGTWTTVIMTLTSGDSVKGTYRGIIPGSVNTNGKRIAYFVTARDDQGSPYTSATNGYFAGITKMSLAGPRAVDTNGVLLWTGYAIRVQGVCTQEDSLIAVPTSRHDVVLQDDVGAMDFIEFAVSSVPPPWRMKRGRVYTVAGVLGQFRGKVQVGIPATGKSLDVVDNGPGVLPQPTLVKVSDLTWAKQGEQLENTLVKIANVRLTPSSLAWPPSGAAGTNLTITDNGVDSITLRVPALSNANGFPPARQPFTIIGIAGQFTTTTTAPFKDGYQVIMRHVDDVVPEVMVALKDTTKAVVGSEIVIPVGVENVNGLGITSFNFDAMFDSTALQFISAANIGTISEGYAFAHNVFNAGAIRVVASGAQPLKDSGAIFTLRFKVLKTGTFTIAMFGSFNEGNPMAMVRGGIVVGTLPSEVEPNDSLSVATPIALGNTYVGELSKATGDPDYFVFNAPVGHLVVDVTDASDATDADLYLIDSTGKVLYNIDRNINDRLEFNLPYAGKYYVRVLGYFSSGAYATGPYLLLARIAPPTDPNEPNDGPLFGMMNVVTPKAFNTTDTTNTLDPGVGIPGNDYDYFSLIATPGQTISVLVKMKTFKSTTTLNNVQARIYRKATFPTALATGTKADGSDITVSYAVSAADTYYVRVVNLTGSEAGPNARYSLTIAPPTGVIDDVNGLPRTFALDQNYPNPFNPATTIRFALPNDVPVKLKVYDMLGREIRTLMNGNMNAGYHQVVWDGTNNSATQVATGIYIYRIEAGSFVSTKKMMLIK
ncbi:MAG: cohesin domain-containing protein [Bacteroidota bacterium]